MLYRGAPIAVGTVQKGSHDFRVRCVVCVVWQFIYAPSTSLLVPQRVEIIFMHLFALKTNIQQRLPEELHLVH